MRNAFIWAVTDKKQMIIICLNPLVAYRSTDSVLLIWFTNQHKLKNKIFQNMIP